MENNQQEYPGVMQPAPHLQITPKAVSFLAATAKWTKFLAIVGFIIAGFLILAGIIVALFYSTLSSKMENTGLMSYFNSELIGLVYIVIAGLYIWPILYLNNFSNAMTRAVRSGTTERLTNALLNLKRFFKFIGILMIVMLVIYLLVILFALGAGLFILGS